MNLTQMHCAPGGQARALSDAQIDETLRALPGWQRVGGEIRRTFAFANYHQTLAFVNATAWISHAEDHHPDLAVHFNRCVVAYSTHDAGGITLNDFICAAKVSALLDS